MDVQLRYRGKQITNKDITFINRLIAAHPEDSRRALSKRLCEAWDWVQPNGRLRDMVCRGLMLELHRKRQKTPVYSPGWDPGVACLPRLSRVGGW